MKNIFKIFRYEIMRSLSRKSYIFTTIGLPIVFIVISQLLQGASSGVNTPEAINEAVTQLQFDSHSKIGYVDHSGIFIDVEDEENRVSFLDEAAAEAALEAGDVRAVYIFEADYLESGAIKMLVPEISMNSVSAEPIKKLIFDMLGDRYPVSTLVRIQTPLVLNKIDVQRAGAAEVGEDFVRNEDTDYTLVYGFGVLFLLMVFGTSGYLMQSVIEEKENRLVEILLSSVTPMQLLTGKTLASGALGLIQMLAWLAIGVGYISIQTANGLPNPLAMIQIPMDMLPIMVIYFVLGYLVFGAGFAAVGAISNSASEGPQLSMIFAAPVLLTFYLSPMFISAPNGAIPTILSIFPLTSPLAMVMRASISPVPPLQVVISIALLLLLVVAMFWVAGRMFRVQTLLSGQVPKLKELPGLIFNK